jgi:hypothetical protein
MAGQRDLRYRIVLVLAVIVALVAIFWKPSVTYTAAIYREPDYVQEPYLIQASASCGSLWDAATGKITHVPPPQYPPPSSESTSQYLALLTTYDDSKAAVGACDSRRVDLGLIFGAAVVVGVGSEVLRRRKSSGEGPSERPAHAISAS